MADLRINRLSKAFADATVLHNVSFAVESGTLIAILGASGSGKTTLLRLIAGFERLDAGEIIVAGELVASDRIFWRPEQRGIGYVAQEGALFPHLSVADNITFGLSRSERRNKHRVPELLEMVDLPLAYARRAPQELSGGEQQRVALARALAPDPKLLLLDEPFSALDAGLRAETRAAVAAAIKAAGATAILVTHDQDEALSMGTFVGVLRQGTLAQLSAPQALYHRPVTADLANFVGEALFFPGIAGNGKVHCALGDLTLTDATATGPVEVMIRPEQLKIVFAPAQNTVPAVIRNVTFYGHDAVVRLRLPASAASRDVIARVFSHSLPKLGSDVWLIVEGEVVSYSKQIMA